MKHKKFVISNIKEDIKNVSNSHLKMMSGIANQVNYLDSYNDITEPGAFDNTVKTRPIVPLLYGHDTNKPAGVAKLSLSSDKSLFAELEINTDLIWGNEGYVLAKQFLNSNRPLQMSIGYKVINSEYDENKNIFFLKELDVFEISLVPFGANDQSEVTDVKKIQNPTIKKQELKDNLKLEQIKLKSKIKILLNKG